MCSSDLASVFALFLGLLIAYVTLRNTERFDAVIGAIWAFGMALGIIFADLTPGYKSDLMSFLFGSILAINHENLILHDARIPPLPRRRRRHRHGSGRRREPGQGEVIPKRGGRAQPKPAVLSSEHDIVH